MTRQATKVPVIQCHCGVREGHLHKLGCDAEECPSCGGQLISCDCAYEMLGLFDESLPVETSHLPQETYENGLTPEQGKAWVKMLEAQGRVPFIVYPNLCARCGVLWPEMFKVEPAEWEKYVPPRHREQILCRPCYDTIKQLIDTSEMEEQL